MTEKKKDEEPFKVFFITSNLSSLDNQLEYNINKSGMVNFGRVLSKTQRFSNENYTISVFSFDIVKEDLRSTDYDKENKKYKAIIKLIQKGFF